MALDPHKWLYLPMGCGCILYKDPATARAAFGHEADYIRTIGLERDEAFAFWDYGPELSRPFRAFDVWLSDQGCRGGTVGGSGRAEHRVRQAPGKAGPGERRFRNAGTGGTLDFLFPL